MRNFSAVVCILGRIVNCVGDEFPMCNTIASQFIGHYFPGFIMMILQQTYEKALGRLAVASCLQKHIDHLAILINRSPQVLLLALDLHKHCVDAKGISKSLMSAFQALDIDGAKLVTPQTN